MVSGKPVDGPLSQARAKATDPGMLKQYFDLLEQTIAVEGKPCQIFNVDESGMPLNAHRRKGIYKGTVEFLIRILYQFVHPLFPGKKTVIYVL